MAGLNPALPAGLQTPLPMIEARAAGCRCARCIYRDARPHLSHHRRHPSIQMTMHCRWRCRSTCSSSWTWALPLWVMKGSPVAIWIQLMMQQRRTKGASHAKLAKLSTVANSNSRCADSGNTKGALCAPWEESYTILHRKFLLRMRLRGYRHRSARHSVNTVTSTYMSFQLSKGGAIGHTQVLPAPLRPAHPRASYLLPSCPVLSVPQPPAILHCLSFLLALNSPAYPSCMLFLLSILQPLTLL